MVWIPHTVAVVPPSTLNSTVKVRRNLNRVPTDKLESENTKTRLNDRMFHLSWGVTSLTKEDSTVS